MKRSVRIPEVLVVAAVALGATGCELITAAERIPVGDVEVRGTTSGGGGETTGTTSAGGGGGGTTSSTSTGGNGGTGGGETTSSTSAGGGGGGTTSTTSTGGTGGGETGTTATGTGGGGTTGTTSTGTGGGTTGTTSTGTGGGTTGTTSTGTGSGTTGTTSTGTGGGANGSTCADAAGCTSGFCVGGLCCESACPDQGATSCGTSGVCTGGVCQTYPAGTVCRAAASLCDTMQVCAGGGAACAPGGFVPLSTCCEGGVSNGTCTTASLMVTPGSPTAQTVNQGNITITVAPNTTITLHGQPVTSPLAISVTEPSSAIDFVHPPALPDASITAAFRLEPSGAQFSPPLTIGVVVDTPPAPPSAAICDDAGTTCDPAPAVLTLVNGGAQTQMDVSVAHFSSLLSWFDISSWFSSSSGPVAASHTVATFVSDVATDHPTWMTDIQSAIGDKTLRELMIPGTHDSGCYNMEDWYAVTLTQTQDKSFAEQLNQGIRYFDVRLNHEVKPTSTEVFWLAHARWNSVVPLQDLLDAVTTFHAAHPQEIIILHVSHLQTQGCTWQTIYCDMVGIDDATKATLNTRLVSAFGSALMSDTEAASATLDELWTSGHTILLASSSYLPGQSFPNDDFIDSPWFDDQDVSALHTDATNALKGCISANSGHPWVLQTVLTPKAPTLTPVWSGAQQVSSGLGGWLTDPEWQSRVNIMIADFSKSTDYVDVAIAANTAFPPGAYKTTCESCTVSGSQLSCICPTNGVCGMPGQPTTLDFSGCAQRISNCAGTLTCGDCTLPGGTYTGSCTGCVVQNNQLACTCGDANGQPVSTTLALPCTDVVSNCNGHLSCGPCGPPGSYQGSCTGCMTQSQQLSCTCPDLGNQPVSTTLGLPCGNDIGNCNGHLTCHDGTLPSGTYKQTCFPCSLNGCTLQCSCADIGGNPVMSSVNVGCGVGIENCDGHLTCGTCPP